MKAEDILSRVDHTQLKQFTAWSDIKALCDDALELRTASVCIPPCYVKRAADYCNGQMKICTVIGFPNGYMTTASKAFETEEAIRNGADEIDAVINLCDVKNGDYVRVLSEIKEIRAVTQNKTLKIIIEACFLTEEEKIKLCEIVTEAGADYIKTSTGFGTGGASLGDIKLMKAHIGENVKIKAAGGIRTFETAERFIEAGADRLGTSVLVKLYKMGATL